MASITLHVPACLVETIRDEFVRYRDVQLDVLGSRPARDRSAAQRKAANLVCATDIVLHSVPWDDIRPDQSVALTADNDLLVEIVHGALLGEVDRFAVECHRAPAAGFDQAEVTERLRQLDCLVVLHGAARDVH